LFYGKGRTLDIIFVGACYIHGVMNGELVEEFGKDKLREGSLMLCKISIISMFTVLYL
jgi:hypothetical protein